ncbi:MAG: metallophosphoesterase [Thermoleophilia bacterium]|nr:metallophosphoesterase [Thermoleophilia bacterium]
MQVGRHIHATHRALDASDDARRRRLVHAPPLVRGGGEADGEDENPERHGEGVDAEHPPRPLGIASGAAWEPRNPTRSFVGHTLTFRALEALEAAPWLQDIAVKALSLVAPLVVHDKVETPPDVPDEPGAWKFAALGDYGAGTKHLAKVGANLARSGAELVITAGDNTYPTGRWQDYQKNWEPVMGSIARSTRFMPALGNHDMYKDDLRPYFGYFPHLKGNAYYTFTEKNAQFYALDGDQDIRPGSAQYRWLEQELKKSKQPWKVLYLHYPMFGSSGEGNEISRAVQPLAEKYGVQLVIAGHEHNYLRAKPIGGVTHLLTGGGGQRVYPFMSKMPEHLAMRAAKYHHLELTVGETKLVARAIDEDGNRIDTVEIPVDAVAQAHRGAALLG